MAVLLRGPVAEQLTYNRPRVDLAVCRFASEDATVWEPILNRFE